jgi:hypothetical protein
MLAGSPEERVVQSGDQRVTSPSGGSRRGQLTSILIDVTAEIGSDVTVMTE